jgi:hypothetical protein
MDSSPGDSRRQLPVEMVERFLIAAAAAGAILFSGERLFMTKSSTIPKQTPHRSVFRSIWKSQRKIAVSFLNEVERGTRSGAGSKAPILLKYHHS